MYCGIERRNSQSERKIIGKVPTDVTIDEAKRLTVAWMPYKLRTHLVNITLTQPRLVGWRRPLFWNQWFDVVDLEGPP